MNVQEMSNGNGPNRRQKITVVGDGMVGKTCMLMTYVKNDFPVTYVPTVFENHTLDLNDKAGRSHTVCLWDTAGQEDFERLRPLSYPDTACFLICFSVDNRTTYENVKSKWHPEVSHHMPRTPIVLVGTKSDVRVPNSTKFVTPSEGNKLKRLINANAYVECSAMKRVNLEEVFEQALLAIEKGPKPKISCTIL